MLSLHVHQGVAYLVAALAIAGIWWNLGRRILLYVLTLQILLGIWVLLSGNNVSPLHYSFAVLAWIGYMIANAIARRGNDKAALGIAVASSVLVLVAYGIGQVAVKGAM
jgi:hypothetical protein